MSSTLDQHYCAAASPAQILSRIEHHYPQGASLFQLAPIDQLHTGGIRASQQLGRHITAGSRVLDIGSGLGGLMRLATEQQQCEVVGLDLTHDFNRLNRQLSQHWQQPYTAAVTTGNGQQLPFADQCFDVVIFQHSLLNMPDKQAALQEALRVLTPTGQLIMHEILQGPELARLNFPLPWASQPVDSHLMTEEILRALLGSTFGNDYRLSDWSDSALEWRQRQGQKEQNRSQSSAPLSPALILGPRFADMGANIMQGLADQAIRVVEVVARRQPLS